MSVHEVIEVEEWAKPLPGLDNVNQEYWQAAREGWLLIQECPACGHRQWYPRALCTACAAAPSWLETSGRGTLHAFRAVIRQQGIPAFKAELRAAFGGVFIGSGGLDKAQAMQMLSDGAADLVAFGRAALANPDLVERFENDQPLNAPDFATFFCEKGKGGCLIEDGQTGIDGKIAVNTSGGLKAKGHPVGATGAAQAYEVYLQLTQQAGKRQVKGAEIGLTHNIGGLGATGVVNILKR